MSYQVGRRAALALFLSLAFAGLSIGAVPRPTPPEVAAILGKLGGNRPITPAEMTRLTAFYHGASAVPVGGLTFEAPDEEDEDTPITFEPNPAAQLAAVRAPTPDEYLALAKEVKALFGARMSAEGRAELDTLLTKATRPGYGADLGVVLLMRQAAPAAVYAIATEALRLPTDGLTANNLGVALKGLREYPRALRVLLYARGAAPHLVLPITNLGFVQALMGDTTTGESTLHAAVDRDPDDAIAAEGLGLLEMARGDVRGALHRLMGMMGKSFLPGGSSAIDAGRQILMDAASEQDDGGQGGGGQGGAAAPDAPVSHPSGPAMGSNPPDFDAPPDITTGTNLCANWKAFGKWIESSTKAIEPVAQEFVTVAARGGLARARLEAVPGVMVRTHERERFALDALRKRCEQQDDVLWRQSKIDEMSRKAHTDTEQRIEAIWQQKAADQQACAPLNGEPYRACMKRAEDRACDARNEMINASYAPIYQAWKTYYEQLHKALWEYHHFCAPWLQDVHEKDLNREFNLEHEIFIRTRESIARSRLHTSLPAYIVWYCEKKPGIPPKQGTIGTWTNIDPTDCRNPPLRMGLGPVSLTGDCDTLKFEGGEGLVTSLTYKIGGPEVLANDELTVFVGVGAKASAGPADLKAQLGPYVTVAFDDEGFPTIKDYGVRSELKGDIELGPASVGAKAEARLGAESGVDASFKPGVKVGVKVKP
ncbi:MAG: hypothetical protein HZB16_04440 [Armatimonadetes bacterium]|nr:hypothetical protein [Armatimonadota bacterium]